MPRDLVALVVHNLVNDESSVSIDEVSEGHGTRIEIRVNADDAGRVIGRGGRVINSIRTLARAAADGRDRVEVQLVE